MFVGYGLAALLGCTLTNFMKFHWRLISENYTTIENLERDEGAKSKYDIGAVRNWEQVLTIYSPSTVGFKRGLEYKFLGSASGGKKASVVSDGSGDYSGLQEWNIFCFSNQLLGGFWRKPLAMVGAFALAWEQASWYTHFDIDVAWFSTDADIGDAGSTLTDRGPASVRPATPLVVVLKFSD